MTHYIVLQRDGGFPVHIGAEKVIIQKEAIQFFAEKWSAADAMEYSSTGRLPHIADAVFERQNIIGFLDKACLLGQDEPNPETVTEPDISESELNA